MGCGKFVSLVVLIIAVVIGIYWGKPPATPIPCHVTRGHYGCPPPPTIEGGASNPSFAGMEEAFRRNFRIGLEDGAQFAVYSKGERVVDMWGQYNAPQYNNRSIQRVFSSTKILESLAIAVAVDKGYLAYEDLVSKHWPEFAQNGKGGITVEDVMKHSAGLHIFKDRISSEVMEKFVAGDSSPLAKIIEASPLEYPGGKKQAGYHAMSRGFVIGEILQRADPQHRQIHTFIKENVLDPLDITDEFQIPVRDTCRVVQNRQFALPEILINFLLPFGIQKVTGPQSWLPPLDDEVRTILGLLFGEPNHPLFRAGAMLEISDGTVGPFMHPDTYRWVFTSASGFATGHALARIAGMMAEGGVYNGKQILSEEGYKKATECGSTEFDFVLHQNMSYTKAGLGCRLHDATIGEGGFTGWGGWGGSVCLWNRKHRLGMGYAMNLMGMNLLYEPRLLGFVKVAGQSMRK